MRKPLLPAGIIAVSILLAPHATWGQNTNYPDSVLVPVIFYDFHSNGTNPDFEAVTYTNDAQGGLKLGMVRDTLDRDRKPILNINKLNNAHVGQWFRPSGIGNAAFTFNTASKEWRWTNLKAAPGGRNGEFTGPNYITSDSMANIVIYDTLLFRLSDRATGTYQFTSTEFFPLDGRGFGTEPTVNWGVHSNHNFSFAMEMHSVFTYKKGLRFDFTGDDDVWAFINNRLKMDIGGIHGPLTGSVNLDTITTLTVGMKYNFDFFYAERHVAGSSIKITTNILSPNSLTVEYLSGDSVQAGSSVPVMRAVIYNEEGMPVDSLGDLVKWTILPPKEPGDTVLTSTGDTLKIGATKAWRTITVQATFTDPSNPTIIQTTTKTIYIKPAAPAYLTIETLANDTGVSNRNAPVHASFAYPVSQTTGIKVYAVTRDMYGNYVDLARNVQWSIDTKGSIAPVSGKGWIGTVTRNMSTTSARDTAIVTASQPGLTQDTAQVYIANYLQTATPTALPGTDNYYGTDTVTLQCATPNATIWYSIRSTTDPIPGDTANMIKYVPGTRIIFSDTTPVTIRAFAISTQPGYTASTVMTRTFINVDYTGPTITRAVFFLGTPPNKPSTGRPDTLVVYFSDSVPEDQLRNASLAYRYIDGKGTETETSVFALSDDTLYGWTQVTYLLPVPAAGKITPVEDSLAIKTGQLTDVHGNKTRADNPPRVIEWGRDYEWFVAIAPNPFIPGKSPLPPKIGAELIRQPGQAPIPASGTVIEISSIKTVDITTSYMVVYDALGNIVKDRLPVYRRNGDPRCYTVWDGTNRDNRYVGSGTYVAMMYLQDTGGGKDIKKQKIGVRR